MQILYDLLREMYYGRQDTGSGDIWGRGEPEPHPSSGLLWIGCTDCRADHSLIKGLRPERIVAHRNIGNQVKAHDKSLAAVIQYAVEILGLEKIVVCGHDNCRGLASVLEALEEPRPKYTPWESWLVDAANIADFYWGELRQIKDRQARLKRLAEINVLAQAEELKRNPYIRDNNNLTIIPCMADTANRRVRSLSGRLIHRALQY
ncbi:MAG: hypothetical protein KDC66_12810 [Phaeodactylibacter sp.]|nr:hypothetical protein [Phaeodactylibacter sp.]MCB9276109.1 hypothetical protein [Lewinellaceae bacterium]